MNYTIDEFDSNQLRKKCVRLELVNPSKIKEISKVLASRDFDLLTLASKFDPTLNSKLQKMGFELITIKSLFELKILSRKTIEKSDVEIILANTIEILTQNEWDEILEPVIKVSRYGIDSKIGLEFAKIIYRRWLENSFSGYAEKVFLAKVNGEAAGMITLKNLGGKKYVDLFSVAEKYRRRGVGSKLLYSVISYILDNSDGVNYPLNVYTQGENIPACKFYQKHGFIISDLKMVYHYHHT